MPVIAGVLEAHRVALHGLVGEHQDLWMPRQQELIEHVDVELAEAAAECGVLLGRQVLVANGQDQVIEVSRVQAHERFVVQWT